MIRAYANDFRPKVVQAYDAGRGSQRALARLLGVSLIASFSWVRHGSRSEQTNDAHH